MSSAIRSMAMPMRKACKPVTTVTGGNGFYTFAGHRIRHLSGRPDPALRLQQLRRRRWRRSRHHRRRDAHRHPAGREQCGQRFHRNARHLPGRLGRVEIPAPRRNRRKAIPMRTPMTTSPSSPSPCPMTSGTGSEWLGSTAWVIQPSTHDPGTIEAVFVRPKGAYLNVTYTLQYAAALGNPTVWQDLVIDTGSWQCHHRGQRRLHGNRHHPRSRNPHRPDRRRRLRPHQGGSR